MNTIEIAQQIDDIADELRALVFDGNGEETHLSVIYLEELILRLSNLSDDIQIEEAERLAAIDTYGRPALCLWCGYRLSPSKPHDCPSLTIRGSSSERQGRNI